MSERPLLTISLLSSGRGATIERCLSSLAPFKEQMDTEILVVDTDTEKRKDVHDILEKYADRIIHFEWCDDFAKARNISVDEAKGEWYLFVDDDEWFIDAQPLIDFLKSDERNKVQWANFRLRNYHDDGLETYGDSWVSRLFRTDYGTRFAGRVHELMAPVKGRPANIEALAGHTGYIFHNDGERREHARRNMELLERLREEEPKEVRWVFQLAQEYNSLHEYGKAEEQARTGYRLMDTARGYKDACIRGVFAADIVRMEARRKRWEDCYSEYKKIRRERKPLGRVSKAYMEYEAARAALELGQTKNCRKHCRRYLEEYDKLHDAPVEWAEDYMYFLMDTFEDEKFALMAAVLIYLELNDGEWEAFDKYFSGLRWGAGVPYAWREFEREILSAACKADYDPRFAEMAGTLWNIPDAQKVLQDYLREITEAGDEDRFKLIRAILESDAPGGKPLDLVIAWEDHEGRRENMVSNYRQLFAMANPLTLDPLLWEIGLRRGAVLDERIREIPFDRWRTCVDECVRDMSIEHIRRMADLVDEAYLGSGDEYCRYFWVKAGERMDGVEEEMRAAAEAQQIEEQKQAAQAEMKQLIGQLETKVEELIAAGLMDEAERVMGEIGKVQ